MRREVRWRRATATQSRGCGGARASAVGRSVGRAAGIAETTSSPSRAAAVASEKTTGKPNRVASQVPSGRATTAGTVPMTPYNPSVSPRRLSAANSAVIAAPTTVTAAKPTPRQALSTSSVGIDDAAREERGRCREEDESCGEEEAISPANHQCRHRQLHQDGRRHQRRGGKSRRHVTCPPRPRIDRHQRRQEIEAGHRAQFDHEEQPERGTNMQDRRMCSGRPEGDTIRVSEKLAGHGRTVGSYWSHDHDQLLGQNS